jgi:hypothetical protein
MDAGDCGIQELKDTLYGIVLRVRDDNTTFMEDTLSLQNDTERSRTQPLVELWTRFHSKSADHFSSSTDNTTTPSPTNTTSTLSTDSLINRTVFVDHVVVPASLPSLYIDLRYVMGVNNRRLVDANHDNAALVRTATISQRHKVMVLTFHRQQAGQTVTILLELQRDGSQQNMELTFKLSLGSPNSSSQDSGPHSASSNNNTHTKTNTDTKSNNSSLLKSKTERSLKELTSAGVDPLTSQQLVALRRASVCFFFPCRSF